MHHNAQARHAGARSYTLIELIMVLAVLALAAAILIPHMVGTDNLTTQAAVRLLIADLSFAQSDGEPHGRGQHQRESDHRHPPDPRLSRTAGRGVPSLIGGGAARVKARLAGARLRSLRLAARPLRGLAQRGSISNWRTRGWEWPNSIRPRSTRRRPSAWISTAKGTRAAPRWQRVMKSTPTR